MTGQPYPVVGAGPRRSARCSRRHGSSATMFTDRPTYLVTRWDDVEQVLRDGRDVLVVDQRRAHRPVHGRAHPRDGRQGAPRVPQPRRARVPRVAARAWDDTLVRPDDRAICSTRSRRSGRADLVARRHEQVPGAGDLRDRRRAARGQRAVPPVGRADQHRSDASRESGWRRRRRCATTSSRSSRTAASTRTGDLISDLVHAEIDGEQLTDEKIYGFLRLLLPAGAETTFRVDGQRAHRAARRIPSVMERVRRRPRRCCPR